MNLYEIQGHSLTFVQCHSVSTIFFRLLFLKKITRAFESKFHIEPPRDIGMNIYSNVPGNMTKLASRPIYGKHLQKSTSELRG